MKIERFASEVRFEATSKKVSELYYQYLDKFPPRPADLEPHEETEEDKAGWAWFSAERDKLVLAEGWTLEEYKAAEDADWKAFYEGLKEPEPAPHVNIIHMDDIEPEPE